MAAPVTEKMDTDAFLRSQTVLNPSLHYDAARGVLWDTSAGDHDGGRASLVAHAPAVYAPFVGNGMLSGLKACGGSSVTAMESDDSKLGTCHVVPVPFSGRGGRQSTAGEGATCLQVDDWTLPAVASNEEEFPSPGSILVAKICGSLASSGYDFETVHTVGRLVCNNLMTVLLDGGPNEGSHIDIEGHLQNRLASALQPGRERLRSVHVNTNEPVLLINDFGRVGFMKLGMIVTKALEQLQRDWNIWPVRVYAGSFVEHDADSKEAFSVTLLNVVNTDIGGPSMIQLLDAPCEASGWRGYARKEIWSGRELLEKDVKQIDQPQDEGIAFNPVPIPHQEQEEGGGPAPDPLDTSKDDAGRTFEGAVDEVVIPVSPEQERQKAFEGGDSGSGLDEPAEPAVNPVELEDRNPPPIEHPTWEHAIVQESLADLIRRQARRSAGDQGERPVSTGETASPVEGAKSDDEFVVVLSDKDFPSQHQ